MPFKVSFYEYKIEVVVCGQGTNSGSLFFIDIIKDVLLNRSVWGVKSINKINIF